MGKKERYVGHVDNRAEEFDAQTDRTNIPGWLHACMHVQQKYAYDKSGYRGDGCCQAVQDVISPMETKTGGSG